MLRISKSAIRPPKTPLQTYSSSPTATIHSIIIIGRHYRRHNPKVKKQIYIQDKVSATLNNQPKQIERLDQRNALQSDKNNIHSDLPLLRQTKPNLVSWEKDMPR
jgi:hypothetical protein